MSHPIYLVSFLGTARDRHAIFVETEPDYSGFLYQVSGTILTGMEFNHKRAKPPEKSNTFISKSYIGTVSETDYARIQTIVESIPPPAKQYERTKRTNSSVPLRRCQEWTAEAVKALRDHSVLRD